MRSSHTPICFLWCCISSRRSALLTASSRFASLACACFHLLLARSYAAYAARTMVKSSASVHMDCVSGSAVSFNAAEVERCASMFASMRTSMLFGNAHLRLLRSRTMASSAAALSFSKRASSAATACCSSWAAAALETRRTAARCSVSFLASAAAAIARSCFSAAACCSLASCSACCCASSSACWSSHSVEVGCSPTPAPCSSMSSNDVYVCVV